MKHIWLSLLSLLIIISPLQAQGRPILSDVWVTTQDFTSLRLGPGTNWERLTVLPPETTLKATGRSVDRYWIQVAYTGEIDPEASDEATIDGVTYGWVAYWLLVWTGDILELPIDGVETVRSARRSGPLIKVGPDSYYYRDGVDPSTRVLDTLDEVTLAEVTGRIGSPSAGYYWIQFELNGEYYWTSTWAFTNFGGGYSLPDGSAVYAYGRLLLQLRQTMNGLTPTLNNIQNRWSALDQGQQTTCNEIPKDFTPREDFFKETDITLEDDYQVAVRALFNTIQKTNDALALFRTVCARPIETRFATAEEVEQALTQLDEARQSVSIVNLLLTPLSKRDPLIGSK